VFDGVGRIRSEDVLGAVTFYDYDLEGNLTAIHVTDPTTDSGDTVAYTYERDALGRLVRFARPDGTSIDVRYSGLRKEVEETSGDGSGGLRILDYDSFERIVRLEEIGGESGPAIWEYDYDALGSLVGLLDADGHYTEIEYDWTSRRRRISRGARSWFYDYDLNGNLLAETSPFPDGSSAAAYTTTFAYDALDRVLQRTPAPRELSATRQAELGSGPIDFYYDGEAGPAANAIGRLSHVALPFGYVSYGYTPRGMASYEERFFAVGAAVASQWVSRSFNALGRVTRVEHDDGTVARTSYDGRGQVDRVEWYDRRAREWKAAADFERSLAGQVRVRESDFRQHRVFEYDSLGRPIRDDIRGGSRMPLRAWREYDYSGSGELIAVRGQNLDLDASAAYEYDGLRRLVSANGPRGYAGEFRYSPAGNVLAARVDWLDSLESRDVTYDYGDVDPQAVDRLVDRATGFVHASFGYDLAGNVVSRETADASFSFTWDGDDQLREAATAEGAEVYYYDHAGSRMLAVDPARGVRFWFGASETRFGSSGAQKQRWIHVGAGGVTLARVENGRSIELQYSDSLQNLLLTLDRAGRPRASFLYGPFGEVLSEEDGEGHRRRFNGKEHDAFTGLRYYGFRYYDALALRWNGADPLYRFRPEAGLRDPQRTNLYAFSLNNPVRYLDPDGRDVVIVWGNDPKLKGSFNTHEVAKKLKADLERAGIKNVHKVKYSNNKRRKQLKKSGKVTTLAFSGHGAPRGQVDPSGHCADGGNCNSPNTTLDDFADAWGLQDDGAMILLSCLSVSGDSEPEQNLAERGIEVAGFSGLLSWNINGKMAEGNYEGRGKELQEKGVTPGNLVVDQQSTKKEDEAKDNVTKIIKRTETKQ
jgi:RHS repeat-associated protein